MRILVSNDDGYLAPGLSALAAALGEIGDVTVVAPDRDCSGASSSLTLSRPLRVRRAPNGFYFVDGTPTDCVHLALFGVLDVTPDIVVSGVNAGANLGDDVIYSGTVAAAIEGRSLGLPSLAISLVSDQPTHFDTAAQVARELVRQVAGSGLSPRTMLNVNVPDCPYADLNGLEVTRLGARHDAEPIIKSPDPRGGHVYWIGPAGAEQDAGPGTDFHALRQGNVAVTPLQIDLTSHAELADMRRWFEKVDL
ncbi:MAG: 5'/3'-nucleotidase SurE [Chromatiales bacterium]|jgi:5'-nucleotidase|nr:5'/3'-nucleotidase SurE [Chromatiales bacterium]